MVERTADTTKSEQALAHYFQLSLFHELLPPLGSASDYKEIFAKGWRFHPVCEDLKVPYFYPHRQFFMLIFCQVTGRRVSSHDKARLVINPQKTEKLFVCTEAYEWLTGECGWQDSR